MTKTEIIAKIEDLYEQLRDNEYSSWYNRSTMTSWEDSYEYMQQYLKDLMLEINKPVVECQHCNGLGCITRTIGTNERGG